MDSEKVAMDVTKHMEVASDSSREEITWTEAEEKIIRNKLDWQTVPIVTLMYLLCFLDR
jgi:hypothetical protein